MGSGLKGGVYFGYGIAWANIVAEATGVNGGAEVTGDPMKWSPNFGPGAKL